MKKGKKLRKEEFVSQKRGMLMALFFLNEKKRYFIPLWIIFFIEMLLCFSPELETISTINNFLITVFTQWALAYFFFFCFGIFFYIFFYGNLKRIPNRIFLFHFFELGAEVAKTCMWSRVVVEKEIMQKFRFPSFFFLLLFDLFYFIRFHFYFFRESWCGFKFNWAMTLPSVISNLFVGKWKRRIPFNRLRDGKVFGRLSEWEYRMSSAHFFKTFFSIWSIIMDFHHCLYCYWSCFSFGGCHTYYERRWPSSLCAKL